jgi:hypothetical protein
MGITKQLSRRIAPGVFPESQRWDSSALFAANEPGVDFAGIDPSILFQDVSGTTITAPGQPAGLVLDKSKGLALGTQLVANPGGPFTVTTNWTTTLSASLNVVDGKLRLTAVADGTPRMYSPTFATVSGRAYEITWTGNINAAAIRFSSESTGAASGAVFNDSRVSGSRIALATASTMTVAVAKTMLSGESFEIESITVRELAGNHASQATAASRPIYGVVPKGGRRNLLLGSDTLATQTRPVTAAAHTLSFRGTGTVTLTGASTAGPLVGTGASNTVSLTFTPTAGNLTLTVSGSVTVAQLEVGSTRTPYQRVGTTAFDITEAGAPTCHYLQFDGVDDWLSTAAIDFSGTDKMSVFAGVRKLSDAAYQQVIELTSSADTQNGSFGIAVATNTGDASRRTYGFATRGTVQRNLQTIGPHAAPDSSVLTGQLDNAAATGSQIVQRRNGQAGNVLGDIEPTSAGNYANSTLFIGRRNGASLAYNGLLFGLVARGVLSSTAEIRQAEKLLARRTSEVTLP